MNFGGAQKRAAMLAKHFSERGYKTRLFILRGSISPLLKIDSRVLVHENIIPRSSHGIIKILRKSWAIIYLASLSATYRKTTILSILDEANTIAPLASLMLLSRPYSVTSQVYLFNRNNHGTLSSHDKILRASILLSHRVIAISSLCKDSLVRGLKIPSEKIKVINNSIPVSDVIRRSHFALSHSQSAMQPFVLGIGRLEDVKRFELLIRALFLVRKKHLELNLIILGDGKERKKLARLIESLGIGSFVSLPGIQENPYPVIRAARAVIVTSKAEGFSNVILEALACGTRVISTRNVGAAQDVLTPFQVGRILEVETPEALAAALEDVIVEHEMPTCPLLLRRIDNYSLLREYETALFPYLSQAQVTLPRD